MRSHCLLTLLLSATAASAAPTESWRWINLADWHGAEKYVNVWEKDARMNKGGRGWRSKGHDSLAAYQAAMRDADIAVMSRIKKDYGGEVLVIPGDTNGGHWYTSAFRAAMRSVHPDLSNDEIVRRAAHLCYGGMRNAFAEAGYRTMVVSVGDHELGDNPWQPGKDRSKFVPTFRAGHADVFNEEPRVHPENPDNPRLWRYESNATSSRRLFKAPIGRVPSRPLGTAYENLGEFSNEYTAWTKSTSVGPGTIGNGVTLTPGKSVLGLSSIGPISHSHPRTVAMWIRTTSPKHQVLFNTVSFWGKGRQFFNLHLKKGQLELMLTPDCGMVAGGPKINDDQWHHVAATVPSQDATLNDVQLCIDGVLQTKRTVRKGGTPINTAQANWMGLGVLLADSSLKLDKQLGLQNFDGSLDDFALTTHGRGNHSVRTETHRYIRYANGEEELYDHRNDPYEWKNIAGNPEYAGLKKKLAKWLPAEEAPEKIPKPTPRNNSNKKKKTN